MPRFLRFVLITSSLLLCLYLFYPSTQTTSLKEPPPDPPTTKLAITPNEVSAAAYQSMQPQISDEDFAKLSLRDQLSAEFPYDSNSVFPSFIWQTWKTTPADPDFPFRVFESSWTDKHPGHIHEVITDDVAAALVKHMYKRIPQVLETYKTLPKAVLKADFFRYLILLARGGVYSDIDTQALKSAWQWVPDDLVMEKFGLVIGIEADPDRADWELWYSRRVQFCQWTMRAKPGHPVLVDAVVRLVEKTATLKKAGTMKTDGLKHIVEWTGPAMWTDVIFEYFNSPRIISHTTKGSLKTNYTWKDLTGITEAKKIGDVIVLPITGFSPGQGHMGSLDYDDPHACVKHDFEGSWKPESERIKPII